MRRFDAAALYEAVNKQRLDRGMTWDAVSKQIGVATATIKRAQAGGRMEVDGMIALVDWLGVPVETFIRQAPR